MNSNFRRTSSVVVVLVLVGALLQAFGGNAAARSDREGRLQGTWRVQLNPRNCQTGAPIPSLSLLLSFARGGTLTEVMNSPALLPGQRTPGLGVWSHTQGNAYKGVWEAFILFDSPPPAPFKRGVQRLMWDFEVDGEQLTIAASSQFFDTNGNPLAVTCASGTGTRFEDAGDEDQLSICGVACGDTNKSEHGRRKPSQWQVAMGKSGDEKSRAVEDPPGPF